MKFIFSSFLLVVFSHAFAQDKTWTCIDENGKEIFTIEAKYVREFSGGLAAIYQQVWDGSKWNQGYGFVNKKGEIVVPCIYKSVTPFKDSVTWVQDNDKKNILIDKKGNVIKTKSYTKVSYFFEGNKGLCAVYEGDNMGFINREGKEVIPCMYMGSSSFRNNRACVFEAKDTRGIYGFIDHNGKVAIPFVYTQAGESNFYKGECRVQKGGKTFLIDTMGNETFKTKYGSLQHMNFNLAPVSLGTKFDKWAYVNRKDEIVFKGPYDSAESFDDDGLAIVSANKKQGVIDTTGKFILEMKYKTIYCDREEDGYICGVYGDESESLDLQKMKKDYFMEGMKKLEVEVERLFSANFSDRIKFSTIDGKYGYMNRKGEIVLEPIYSRAELFSEGRTWIKK